MKRIGSKNFNNFITNNKLLVNCGILAILFLINCFLPEFSYVCFISLAVMIILNNIEDGFTLWVASIPFCCLNGYASIIMMFVCLVIYVCKYYFLAIYRDKKEFDKLFLILMLVTFLYMLSNAGELDLMLFAKVFIVSTIILIFYLFALYPNAPRLHLNLCLLAIMMFVSVIYCLGYYPFIGDSHSFYYVGDEFIRFEALLINPNTVAMICEICVALLAYFMLCGKGNVLTIISFVIFSVLGFCSFSKTFLLLFAIVCIVLFVKSFKIQPKKSLMVLTFVLIGCTIAFLIFRDYATSYLERFISGNIKDYTSDEVISILTTSRSELWITYIQYLFMNPIVLIFGKGLNAKPVQTDSAHNVYISMIYELGIFGTIFFVCLITMVIKKIFQSREEKVTNAVYLPITILALLMCVEDLIFYLYF